jgi:glycine cleavage system H protein
MTALLVLAMFIIFLTIDYVQSRKRGVQPVVKRETPRAPMRRWLPAFAAGFGLPGHLKYHPGHTWALGESPDLVRVGLDDFAARLLGKVETILLPQRGRWVRQGQPLVTFFRDGVQTKLVSPIEGVVANVNDAVLKDPSLSLKDPYGEGWLITVNSPDATTNFRNLLGGDLARSWMEEAASRLRGRIPALAGAVAQDGGLAEADLTKHLPDSDWAEVTREFFLT